MSIGSAKLSANRHTDRQTEDPMLSRLLFMKKGIGPLEYQLTQA